MLTLTYKKMQTKTPARHRIHRLALQNEDACSHRAQGGKQPFPALLGHAVHKLLAGPLLSPDYVQSTACPRRGVCQDLIVKCETLRCTDGQVSTNGQTPVRCVPLHRTLEQLSPNGCLLYTSDAADEDISV